MTLRKLRVQAVLALCVLSSCAVQRMSEISNGPTGRLWIWLFSAEKSIQDAWQHIPLRGETDYRVTADTGIVAIRATGQYSASLLIRSVHVDPVLCPQVDWRWRVDQLQESADIRVKEKEDVGASIILLFGDPGTPLAPNKVPSLRYVWTNKTFDIDSVVDSPYLPGFVKSLVVRSGLEKPGWVVESRNVLQDFERAFGYSPNTAIEAVALFTDNDQTRDPVVAYYEWARAVCKMESR